MANGVQSVGKAMELLDLMAREHRPLSLSEITRFSGWPKSTVHGLLSSLVEHSVVEQCNEDGKYMLGIRLFEYGCSVSANWNIAAAGREQVRHLSLKINESAFISALAGSDSVILELAESSDSFKIVSEPGKRSPVYSTSQGKVLLAYQPPGSFQNIVKGLHFQKFTPHTIDSVEALRRNCDQVLAQGYCLEKGEYRMGLCSVSAPIRSMNGDVRFAVGVVGMFQNVHDASFQRIVDEVVHSAEIISYNMGYRSGEKEE